MLRVYLNIVLDGGIICAALRMPPGYSDSSATRDDGNGGEIPVQCLTYSFVNFLIFHSYINQIGVIIRCVFNFLVFYRVRLGTWDAQFTARLGILPFHTMHIKR